MRLWGLFLSGLLVLFPCTAWAASVPAKSAVHTGTVKSSIDAVKPAAVGTETAKIRVGLLEHQDVVNLSATAEFVLRDGANGQGILKLKPGETVSIGRQGKNFLLNKKGISAQSLRVLVTGKDSSALLLLNGRKYHGTFLLKVVGNGIEVVNKVPMEEYLYGVLPEEMSYAWPAEALKAQAVAARTFALYNRGKHDDFDVCATTHCQVYGGADSEQPQILAAVDATRGEVLCYMEKPIYAAFHMSSGGMTENSEDVWGNRLPYLRAVTDDDTKSPSHHWKMKLSVQQFEKKLASSGHDVGKLQRITLTPLVQGTGKTEDRTASGRVRIVEISGSKGVASLTGNQMRSIFGLKSTLFDLILEHPDIKKVNADMGFEKKDITANLPDVKDTHYLDKKVHILSGQAGENILFDGYGWGHGLGLSQWGAKAMAAKAGYKEILLHYYTKVDIKKLY